MKTIILSLTTLLVLISSCKKEATPAPSQTSQPTTPAVVQYEIKLEVTDTDDNQSAQVDIYINGDKISPTWFGTNIPMRIYTKENYTLKENDILKVECRNNNHSGYDLDQDIKIYSNNTLVFSKHQNANTFESITYIVK